jgi:uncharacterized membrane protein
MNISLKTLSAGALLAALALSATSAASAQQRNSGATAPSTVMERCYGVARAGHNDCAAGAHSCAGQSTRDNDPASYVELPAGACAKLAHGSTTAGR